MPATRIDTRRGWIADRRTPLLEAVQRALVAGLRIPPGDRSIVLAEHDADAFRVPEDCGEAFMVVEIALISGRSLDAKRRLYGAMAEEMARFGVAASDLRVILRESPAENWGVRGQPASEIDLGFEVNV
ncbi:tautomerase family protein [Aureimonas psammosilenae]|uniref:tautomerase family protein n=1 Tax=Aureimonas psammosilenae TaxID=2495496 RepID=UPI0012612739|nr:tautomerase family protein [Aureimonas psammosilenae]